MHTSEFQKIARAVRRVRSLRTREALYKQADNDNEAYVEDNWDYVKDNWDHVKRVISNPYFLAGGLTLGTIGAIRARRKKLLAGLTGLAAGGTALYFGADAAGLSPQMWGKKDIAEAEERPESYS